jgi:sulfite reductase (NADPH) hemoprotein beta-component
MEVKVTRNEVLKEADPTLGGSLALGLSDPAMDHFEDDDGQFLKFHGIYQQDDRDRRKTGKHYLFMVRTKFPGGVLTADQYGVCDDLATRYGDHTLRITTRQDFQFHGVIKQHLRRTVHELNRALITTLGACGDVSRNVLAPPAPSTSPLVDQVLEQARRLSDALAPRTPAYHQLWIEGEELKLPQKAEPFTDPLYGKTYLPRKFKAGFAIPPVNDVDIFTQDLGFVVIAENGSLAGYNLLAGGGLGMSHGNAQTFPRLADVIGFVAPSALEPIAKAVLGVHRDFGDRTNRRHARLKYVLAEKGVDWFRAEVEARAGVTFAPPRPFSFTSISDQLGWHRQLDDRWFLGLFVENGRIADREARRLKTGLRAVVERYRPEIRLTASQNLLFVGIAEGDRQPITQLLAEHGIDAANPFSPTRLASMACPALPTCGLALAESERTLPGILTQFEALLAELGLAQDEIIVRMTGCPNGCARPYLGEIGFVGKAPGKYQIYLGADAVGTRLNRLYQEAVKESDLLIELRPLLERFRAERRPGERFGDWVHRSLPGPAA